MTVGIWGHMSRIKTIETSVAAEVFRAAAGDSFKFRARIDCQRWGAVLAVHREVELKYRLRDRQACETLCSGLGVPFEDYEQVNYFFQSEDGKMPGMLGVIRLRVERGEALFTVKLGGPLKDGLVSAQEYEEPWKGPPEDFPPATETLWEKGYAGLEAVAAVFGGPFPLVCAGQMRNRRRVYPLPEGIRLEVDASLYPDGHEDFEVEVETDHPEEDRVRLEALLAKLNVGHEPQTETKYQRFLLHAGTLP